MKTLKEGDIIYADSHADLLNQVFGTNYKAWMKSVWNYNDETVVWMVRFNQERSGWYNSFVSNSRIREENIYRRRYWNNRHIRYVDKKRIAFEIDDSKAYRKYIFRGVYVYDEETSDPSSVRYHNKISSVFPEER